GGERLSGSGSGPGGLRATSGNWLPELTSCTGPVSGWLSSGEAATADPTTELAGQLAASKAATSQTPPKRLTFGLKSLGTVTAALISPASSRSWSIEVEALVGTPLAVWPAPPTKAVKDGEKSRLSQPVVANFAIPVSVAPV